MSKIFLHYKSNFSKTMVFHVSNNAQIHVKYSGGQWHNTTLESQYQTASCVCQQWRVVAFVDITWNVEASSNSHKCLLAVEVHLNLMDK